MRQIKNISGAAFIVTLFLFSAWETQLAPSKAEAQACVDMQLIDCGSLFPVAEALVASIAGTLNETFQCICPRGYAAVSTVLSSGCTVFALPPPAPPWYVQILAECPGAHFTTLCIGSP